MYIDLQIIKSKDSNNKMGVARIEIVIYAKWLTTRTGLFIIAVLMTASTCSYLAKADVENSYHQDVQANGLAREYTANDLCVVLRATGNRLECPPAFVSSLKNAINQFPTSLRNLLGSRGVKIVLTPSSIEHNPMLCNTRPSGYEDGMTYKNCGGYCGGREIVICAYRLMRDESGWEPTSEYINTLRHEMGHEIDYLLGDISQQELYRHAYLLDVGAMDDSMRDNLAYFTQKARSGPSESFAEIVCIILGGGQDDLLNRRQQLIRQYFPRSFKIVSQLISGLN